MVRWIVLPLCAAAIVSVSASMIWARIVRRIGVIRHPGGRHWHLRPALLWGGLAPAAVCIAAIVWYPEGILTPQFLGMVLGAVFLALLGAVDDVVDLDWRVQVAGHFFAALLLVAGGAVLSYIRLPMGGALALDTLTVLSPSWACLPSLLCPVPVWGALVTVLWTVVVINAVNWFDGTDGLAALVLGIAFAAIAAVSLRGDVMQPAVAIAASLGAGAVLGFLPVNFPPAKQFLGTAGAAVFGFMIAALSVLAGAKVATTATVLALPACDMLFVLFLRLRAGVPLTAPDTRHLHHWLLARGVSRRAALIGLGVLTVFAALPAVMLSQPAKFWVLGILCAAILAAFFFFRRRTA